MSAWSVYSPAMEFSAWIGYVVVFFVGGRAVLAGHMSPGEFAGFLALIGMFYAGPATAWVESTIPGGPGSGRAVFDILDAPVEVGERPVAEEFARARGGESGISRR